MKIDLELMGPLVDFLPNSNKGKATMTLTNDLGTKHYPIDSRGEGLKIFLFMIIGGYATQKGLIFLA